MGPSFGARLRAQREQQQVALAAISQQTKIKMSLLEGLERDDLSHWPTGIFRRAYIRAYAQAIGLEPGAVVREFLERYPDPEEDDEPAVPAAARGVSISRRPPTRLGLLIGSAIGALPALRPQAGQRGEPAIQATTAAADSSAQRHPVVRERDGSAVAPPIVETADEAQSVERGPVPLNAEVSAMGPVREGAADGDSPRDRNPFRVDLDLSAIAQLCTRLARAAEEREVAGVLGDAARMLNAVGLILWMWDPRVSALTAVLAHGYADEVLTRLPRLRREADNAVAAAFRSAETRVVDSRDQATGAVVVPLMTPSGCPGVLALESRDGGEQHPSVHALATILAAHLSALVGSTSLALATSA